MEENNKTVETQVEGQEQNPVQQPAEGTPTENKPVTGTVEPPKESCIDRQYAKYCAKRKAKAEKKANKKGLSKGQKTGVGIGAGLLGAAILGGIGTAVVRHYANMGESDYELGSGEITVDDSREESTDYAPSEEAEE